ncbi:cation-translocating P-type ATPase [Siccirubricoccus sp. G192]|uniref:cation-translocating P-type ATPase n=1 Tax=Siccirubricoccus sp. G192 TaxID=2849651 RepID=UPI001C2B975C|nr:cation-translocating P-type ATPase [Siccirubricoccus sp. G192]MBV1796370.1 cation-translocating P-type ATPase [Siccirubricoccus sp. G192]
MTDHSTKDAAADAAAAPWHRLTAEEAAGRLGSPPGLGLAKEEAARRLESHGRNEIREQRRRGVWTIFLGQFTDFMILLLIVAAAISGLIGEPEDAIAILAIVVLNAVIGFVQEYRAERALQALKQLAALRAHAVRGGQVVTVPTPELVPGDLVLLEAGSVVPADLRLVEAVQLRVDEAALTGESQPVEKRTVPLAEADLPLGDRSNMAFGGTVVTYGRGRGIAVGTGMETELGRIAALLSSTTEVRTPLQKRLGSFGRQLSLAAIAICVLVFALGVLRGEPVVLMFLTAVSLAVAAVPEALPAVVTIALALGAQRMVRRNALIRRLPAVETLGSVTYICSDKTGTLTQNRMHAEAFLLDGEQHQHLPGPETAGREPWNSLLRALALSNDASADGQGAILGDPTEAALFAAAHEAGFERAALEAEAPRVAELPFDSERKRMTTLHALPAGGGVVAYTKGAPEALIERCTARLTASGLAPLDAAPLLAAAERMAAEGLRVLAIARRDWPAVPTELSPETVETGLTFVGLVGLIDPPRPEAARAVDECRSAGITPVMITGDHPLTARAIAARLGILEEGEGRALTGRELARLPDEELARRVREVRVYARVDPEQKIRIVRALQSRGEFVAMTGDGVNDAPALKSADIGIAMGNIGTDVTREASDMVLLDDNFASIVAAVREGRRIYDNIRKFIRFVLAGNTGEILTLLAAPFFGLPIPLLPIHILWVNLVTDGLPGLALAAEPEEEGIMQRPPQAPGESIFAHGLGVQVLWVGLLIGVLAISTQAWAIATGSPHWQTMVFTSLTFAQLFQVMGVRTERQSLFRAGLASNLPLFGAVLLGAALQLAVIYIPFLNDIMKTQPLSAAELAFCILVPSLVLVALEGEKWLVRRGVIHRGQARAPLAGR